MKHVKSLCRIPTKKYVSWVLVSWVLVSASWSSSRPLRPDSPARQATSVLWVRSSGLERRIGRREVAYHRKGLGVVFCVHRPRSRFWRTLTWSGVGSRAGSDECNWWVPLTALLLSGLIPPTPPGCFLGADTSHRSSGCQRGGTASRASGPTLTKNIRTRSFFPGFFFFFQNLDQIRTSRVHATKVGLGHCL